MNFFEHQAAARRASIRLIVLFSLAVVFVVLAVDVAVVLFFGFAGGVTIQMLGITSLGTLAVIAGASYYRTASLRQGGATVAEQLGGIEVREDDSDPALRRYRNVVEEIAIASGVPVPRLYVLVDEPGINAFAAGYSPSDAVIAVTRGSLQRLNRDELQGVIAHEFSHILNGDMRLNIRMMGLLFGILMLSVIGRYLLQSGVGGRGRRVTALIMTGAVAIAIGYVGVFIGRLIKAGVSRQREYLADASAVQFTRQTAGLAGALKKIGGLPMGSQLDNRAGAEEVSHMLFGEGLAFSSLFATHPPLLRRIQRLQPRFNAEAMQTLQQRWAAALPDGRQEDIAKGLFDWGTAPSAFVATTSSLVVQEQGPPSESMLPPPLPAMPTETALRSEAIIEAVGTSDRSSRQFAHDLIENIPSDLRTIAHDKARSLALLLALLLDDHQQLGDQQRAVITQRLDAATADAVFALRMQYIDVLHPILRLPLASMAFPAIRRQPRSRLTAFLDTISDLVHLDGQVSLFEYCLSQLLHTQVTEALNPSRYVQFKRDKATNVKREFATLLAVIAQAGHDDPQDARRAYLAGMNHVLPRDHQPYEPPVQGVIALDSVWEPLNALNPIAKQVMVEALVSVISHDGKISLAEADLLRVICGVLHCPLPAVLNDAVGA